MHGAGSPSSTPDAADSLTVVVLGDDDAARSSVCTALRRHAPGVAIHVVDDTDAPVSTTLDAVANADCLVVTGDADETGLALLERVRRAEPHHSVVLVVDDAAGPFVDAAVAVGAVDVVSLADTPESLVAARLVNATGRGQGRSFTELDPSTEWSAASTEPDERELDALKRRALDAAELGVVISEATDGTPTVFANEGFGRLTGYDPDDFVGRNCRILQGAETDDRPVQSIRDALANERAVSVVLRNYRKDGTAFWNEVEINPLRDDSGAVTHYLGFQRDVTERKRLERELSAARRSLRQLYTVTTEPSLSFEERVERTLEIGCRRLGVSLGFVTRIEDDTQHVVQAVGDHPLLQPGERCPLSESYCRRTLDTDGLLAVVHSARDDDWTDDLAYETFGLECYVGGKITVDGDVYGTLCFADVDPREEPFSESQAVFVELLTRWVGYEIERRKDERKLQTAEQRFRSLFDNPHTFVGVLDTDGTLREVNDTAESTLERGADSVLGQRFWEATWWTTDDAVETVRTAVEMAADGHVAPFECQYTHVAGSGTVGATLYPVYGSREAADGSTVETDEVVSLIAIGADTTKRTEQAAQLKRQRDRLERFASVVSHDLRSPLEVARGRLQLYEKTGDESNLDSVETSLDRLSALVDDLLELARHGDSVADVEPTAISAVARQAWHTVSTTAVEFVVDIDPEATVDADPSRLQQLFENLFRNAAEHGVEDDERITVRLTGLDGDARGFAVEDDGRGIDPSVRDVLFERGITTNDAGTGFGLAIVERIVDAHGWRIDVTEGASGGARFEIRVEE